MNMDHVVKVDGEVCEMLNDTSIIFRGRKVFLHTKERKIVYNSKFTGRYVSKSIRLDKEECW